MRSGRSSIRPHYAFEADAPRRRAAQRERWASPGADSVIQRSSALFVLCMATLISACASNPSVSSLTSEEHQRVAEMVVLQAGAISRESYKILGSVEGLACKRNFYANGSPNIDEAKQGVRIRAAQLEADAVTNMVLRRQAGSGLGAQLLADSSLRRRCNFRHR